jgi:hypothetical protein
MTEGFKTSKLNLNNNPVRSTVVDTPSGKFEYRVSRFTSSHSNAPSLYLQPDGLQPWTIRFVGLNWK